MRLIGDTDATPSSAARAKNSIDPALVRFAIPPSDHSSGRKAIPTHNTAKVLAPLKPGVHPPRPR